MNPMFILGLAAGAAGTFVFQLTDKSVAGIATFVFIAAFGWFLKNLKN